MNDERGEKTFPEGKTPGDHAYSVGKIAAGLVPYVGGALAELLDAVFASPLDRRRAEWLRGMGTTIEKLCQQVEGMTPEKLSQNEEFISACQHASTVALRSHQEEKRAALRAALKNVVLRPDAGPLKAEMFIRLIDEFTVLHLRLLDIYDRAEWYREKLQAKGSRVFVEYPTIASIWDEHEFKPRSDDPLIRLAETGP